MLPSREVTMQLENQRFYMSNSVPVTRQLNGKPGSEHTINNISSPNNLVQGIGTHIPVSNATTVPCSSQNSASSVYNGFYSSSTFNSINNFEASLQWLTESRIPSNGLLSDKNLPCGSHSTPSHSCCVNRLSGVENVGLCSPLSSDSYRSGRETVSYQTKPPALSVNVMDSMQNWFNLPPLPNQQYGAKFNDQTMNCSQMTLPMMEQSDLKQADICLQIPDSYFEQTINNNAKQLNVNNIELNNKLQDLPDTSTVKSFNNGYQSNIISRDVWKQPSLQTAASYISSPTLFNSLNDSPEHYLYSLPPPVTSSSSYCMVSDNTKLSQSSCSGGHNHMEKQVINPRLASCSEQHIGNQLKTTEQPQINQNLPNTIGNKSDKSLYLNHRKIGAIDVVNTLQSSCNVTNSEANKSAGHYSTVFMRTEISSADNGIVNRKTMDASTKDKEKNTIEIADETSSSGSEESNIIVEESDDMEEIDSVISIDEIKKGYISEEPVELRCLICNVKSSIETPATQFIHMNDSFPLTTASKTPVASKLIQILPTDLQHFLKLHNSFMCRRCLNLIETVEVLEVKLTSVKQTLSENFSRTVQCLLPATPIVEIENGTATIIDKEIVKCIDQSNLPKPVFQDSVRPVPGKTPPPKDSMTDNTCVQLEGIADEADLEDERRDEETGDYVEGDEDDKDQQLSPLDVASESSRRQQCNVCGKVLSSVRKHRQHIQLHTKEFSFYCECCGKGFSSHCTLEKHVKSHNEDCRYQCEKCGKTYSQKHRLDNHLKRHSGEYVLCCEECGKGFVDKRSLELHVRTHKDDRPYICEICGAQFVQQSNLTAHLQLCKKEEIGCDECTKVFYSKRQVKRHKIDEHNAEPDVKCEVCGKIFVNMKDLKPHMRSHSVAKPFECKVCGKRYKSVGNLNHHAKIHDPNKLFKCGVCEVMFSSKKLLDDHMNRHTGERVFRCDDCGKEFLMERHLKKHSVLHSDRVKLKSCGVCGKKFRNGLAVHMRTHTGEKAFVCSHCGQAFAVNNALTRHVQAKHQNVFES